jgi:hypothetical protein
MFKKISNKIGMSERCIDTVLALVFTMVVLYIFRVIGSQC